MSLLVTLRNDFIVVGGCNRGTWPDRRAAFIPNRFCGTLTGVEGTFVLISVRAGPIGVVFGDRSTNSEKLDFQTTGRCLGVCKGEAAALAAIASGKRVLEKSLDIFSSINLWQETGQIL